MDNKVRTLTIKYEFFLLPFLLKKQLSDAEKSSL
jgi:hypothetical protein